MTSILTPEDPRWNESANTLSEAITQHGCRHDHQLAAEIMMQMGDDIDIHGSLEFLGITAGIAIVKFFSMSITWSSTRDPHGCNEKEQMK
jgi:hypothetical protein